MKSLLLTCLLSVSALAASKRPNVVIFLVDDLGQRDLACYGSTFYETPHIDRLAKEGLRFTSAYAACPVCSPTRASILTGKYPQRTGITDYIGAPQPTQWKRNTPSIPPAYTDRLAHEEITLAEMLKEQGYATFHAGKWHLGPEGWWPENQGFDFNLGGIDRGGPYGGKKYFSPYGNPRLTDGPPGEHLPDRLATETVRFITAHKEKPFFVYFPFYSVHTPLIAREDLRQKYAAKREHLGLQPLFGDEPPRKVRQNQEHAIYAAMVEAMDAAVGKVVDQLDALGLSENTLILFTSDNGGLSTSEGSPTSNLPLRAGKGWLYEGGIRVPLIARWKGVITPGRTLDVPTTSPDFFPTIQDALSLPNTQRDGVSLLPLFKGTDTLPERPIYWHFPHYSNAGKGPGAAIRLGKWKLIDHFDDQRIELFDLASDLSETNDLAQQHPDIVRSLTTQLRAWQQDVGAKMPTPNPAYRDPKPGDTNTPTQNNNNPQ